MDNEELDVGLVRIATPIENNQGDLVAVMSVPGISEKMHEQEKAIEKDLLQCAAKIKQTIGDVLWAWVPRFIQNAIWPSARASESATIKSFEKTSHYRQFSAIDMPSHSQAMIKRSGLIPEPFNPDRL